MQGIEDLLRALAEDDEGDDERAEKSDNNADPEQSDGIFSGLDPEMLLKMMSLFETLNQPDDNEKFLLALKPLLREENRVKIDSAVKFLKFFSILPILKESGFLDNLF